MIQLLAFWSAYFLLHSYLASAAPKSWVESRWPALPYRLAYNIAAAILLVPGLWLLFGKNWPVLWEFKGIWEHFAHLAQFLAVSAFLFSLKYYDMSVFLGLKPDSAERFTISPFHRHVRHPWYGFALVLIWANDMDSGRFAFSLLTTLYLFLGSRHEEAMLIERFGSLYESYRKKVPALIPLPWKHLTPEEAESLVK